MRKFAFTIAMIFGIAILNCDNLVIADGVVNVSSRSHLPPNVSGSAGPLEQFLTAGNYSFALVNNVGGHANFDSEASFTAWSYHNGDPNWGTNYSFSFDDGDSSNDTLGSEYIGPDRGTGGRFTQAATGLLSFDATVAADRLQTDVHIPFDQTIGFYISDHVRSDNAGGVSIRIFPTAVPEPSTVGFLSVLGIGWLGLRRRRHWPKMMHRSRTTRNPGIPVVERFKK